MKVVVLFSVILACLCLDAPTDKLMMSPSGNKDIGAGDSVTLDCHVRGGNPIATLTWRCKGALRTGKNLTSTDTARSTLTVTVDKTYNGHICACIATQQTNPGREIGRKTVEFNVIYPPLATNIYLVPSGTETVTNGTTQRLECQLKGGNPLATLTWRCKESPRIGVNLTTSNLSASRLTFTVDETYHGQQCVCTATYSKTTIGTKTVVFNVLYAPTDKLMMSPSGNKNIGAGDSVTLDCHVRGGNPIATLTWRCKGALRTGKNMTSTDTARSTLTVTVDKTYNGHMCACIATQQTNPGREIGRKTVEFNVIYAPVINLNTSKVILSEGESFNRTCSAHGNPSPNVSWVQDLTTLPSTGVLFFSRIEKGDAGIYVCLAENGITSQTRTKSFRIIVQYAPEVDLAFTNMTENTTNASLNCTARGVPSVYKFRWIHKIGSTVVRDLDDHVINSESVSTLTLPRVSYQDMGTYICEVENGIKGSDGQIVQTKQGIIFVEGSPRAINAQGRYLTKKNTSLDFNITYVSFPAPVNTSLIRYGSTLPVVTVSAATVTLPFYNKNISVDGYMAQIHFSNIKTKHQGRYQLYIKNGFEYYYNFDIIISDSPSAPTQVFADCKGFGSAEVSWLAGDNGGHTQSFQVLYQTDGNVYKYPDIVTENDSDDYVLTVENLAEQSLYIFTILAFNDVGNVTSTDLGKCTIHGEVSPNKQTAIFSASVAMLCIGILALLLTIGVIAIFVKRKGAILGKRPEKPIQLGRIDNADEEMTGNLPPGDNGTLYEVLNSEEMFPPSVYETIGHSSNDETTNQHERTKKNSPNSNDYLEPIE